MVKKIKINEEEFNEWLQNAWHRQHDGLDRGFWYDPIRNKTCTTCETKNTMHNPSGELILIAWINGDNNADYDDICFCCSSYLGRNEETGEVDESCCDAWEGWKECELEYTDTPSFKNMQYECMQNVGWVEDVRKEAMEELDDDYEIVWI